MSVVREAHGVYLAPLVLWRVWVVYWRLASTKWRSASLCYQMAADADLLQPHMIPLLSSLSLCYLCALSLFAPETKIESQSHCYLLLCRCGSSSCAALDLIMDFTVRIYCISVCMNFSSMNIDSDWREYTNTYASEKILNYILIILACVYSYDTTVVWKVMACMYVIAFQTTVASCGYVRHCFPRYCHVMWVYIRKYSSKYSLACVLI
jgi:hypothetical protein